jgi:hypothetical protein
MTCYHDDYVRNREYAFVYLPQPSEHGNTASRYASGLQHDLHAAYSHLVRKRSAGLRVPYALTLPGSSLLALSPHTFERLRSSTRRNTTTHTQTLPEVLRETDRPHAGEPRANSHTHTSDLTYTHPSACSLFFTAAYITWLVPWLDADYSTASC